MSKYSIRAHLANPNIAYYICENMMERTSKHTAENTWLKTFNSGLMQVMHASYCLLLPI